MKLTIETTKSDSMYCAHCIHLDTKTETSGLYSETYAECNKDQNLDVGSVLSCESFEVTEFTFQPMEAVQNNDKNNSR